MRGVCEWCGEAYERRPDRLGRFCSRRCRDQAAITAITVVCATCGKEFKVNRYRAEHHPRRHCSIACSGRALTTEERFWRFVDKSGECWVWTGARDRATYGRFNADGQTVFAHRYALSLHLGRDLATGAIAAHHCDNPPCVRPDHLFETTHAGNVADKIAKGRDGRPDRRGERNGLARLSTADVLEIRRRAIAGESSPRIAKDFNIDYTHVWKIVRRKIWTHI